MEVNQNQMVSIESMITPPGHSIVSNDRAVRLPYENQSIILQTTNIQNPETIISIFNNSVTENIYIEENGVFFAWWPFRSIVSLYRNNNKNRVDYPIVFRMEHIIGISNYSGSSRYKYIDIQEGVTPTVIVSEYTREHSLGGYSEYNYINLNSKLIDSGMSNVSLVALDVYSARLTATESNMIKPNSFITLYAEIVCRSLWMYGGDYNCGNISNNVSFRNWFFGDLNYFLTYEYLGNNTLYDGIRILCREEIRAFRNNMEG